MTDYLFSIRNALFLRWGGDATHERFYDQVNIKRTEPTRSAEEIVEEVVNKLGLTVLEE